MSTFRFNTYDFIKSAGVWLSSHLARFACIGHDDASTMRLRAKVTNFPPFRGCEVMHERRTMRLRLPSTRSRLIGGRARSRFLRHAQWVRYDIRAIIRARCLDTFNCHVNLFAPRCLSRAAARSFASFLSSLRYRRIRIYSADFIVGNIEISAACLSRVLKSTNA